MHFCTMDEKVICSSLWKIFFRLYIHIALTLLLNSPLHKCQTSPLTPLAGPPLEIVSPHGGRDDPA